MDPLRFSLAIGPLALYLLALGLVNLSRRPLLVSGPRDLAAMAVAVLGLMIVGPLELLLPQRAANYFGVYVWLTMLVAYAICVTLLILVSRPRLTIYNISETALRPALAQVVESMDPEARRAGQSLVLPHWYMELHVEAGPRLRVVSLVANGDDQNLAGWRQLESALAARLQVTAVGPNPWGAAFVSGALTLLGLAAWQLVQHPAEVAQGFYEMLRVH